MLKLGAKHFDSLCFKQSNLNFIIIIIGLRTSFEKL